MVGSIVWERLEEQNPNFFKFYYTRLALKKQIEQFNKLLDKQKQLMDEEQTNMSSPYMFGSDGKTSEAGPNVGNASATPITSTLHSVNELDSDFPYTYLSPSLSREYSLSDMLDYLFSGMFSLFCFYVIMHGCV
jgi:hypothetical protein